MEGKHDLCSFSLMQYLTSPLTVLLSTSVVYFITDYRYINIGKYSLPKAAPRSSPQGTVAGESVNASIRII